MTDLRCTSCGSPLDVGPRQARRIRRAGYGRCGRCRPVEPSEADFQFWANRFGVQVPEGESARSVLASGVPPALAEVMRDWT